MKPIIPALVAASALGLVIPAQAQVETDANKAVRLIQRIIGHYGILAARTLVDLAYDSVTVQSGTNNMILSGLKLYPDLPWDDHGACQITVDRIASGDVASFETLQNDLDISGVHVPAACFDPGVSATMAAFGYEGITADAMSIEIAYNLPRAAADISIQASVTDVGDIGLSANFDYLWARFPIDGPGDDLEPVAYLGEAELVIENNGLWERLEPFLTEQFGGLEAVPQLVQAMLSQTLSEGGTRAMSPADTAFVMNFTTELDRFLKAKDRIVLTVAPENAILLGEDVFQSPAEAIALLQPRISAIPVAYRRMVGPDELSAALAGGAGLDADTRLRVGEALITGVGAPRSVDDGAALLSPLSEEWNGRAALVLGRALADNTGSAAQAYGLALRALAEGESEAIAIADGLEADIPVAELLAAQNATSAAWPGAAAAQQQGLALIAAGDIAGLRRMAQAFAVGKSMPRDYETAYFLATLAAAGGDRGAVRLRDGLDQRFGGDPAWKANASQAASEALHVWTNGLGATIAARLQ